jgi:molybdopterin molybdotransferase
MGAQWEDAGLIVVGDGPSCGRMISLEAARTIICEAIRPLPVAATPLAQARGCALGSPVLAPEDMPDAARSTVDGYAVRHDAQPGEFEVVETIAPGMAAPRGLAPGTAARVFTGAVLPEGAHHVVMQEAVVRVGERIQISSLPRERLVRERGAEAAKGDVLIEAGLALGAAELAILAHVGVVRPEVMRRPAVRCVATGNELVDPGETPGPGAIRDSNSTLLRALLAEFGIEPRTSRVADDFDALLEAAGEPADVLLISGGASVGDFDFGARILRELGFEVHFDQVNLRPGKPLTFASRGSQAAFVVPGNPVSHFVCWHVAVRAAFERMMGLAPRWGMVRARLEEGGRLEENARETFWPARAFADGERIAVRPRLWKSSGDIAMLAGVNALVRVAGPLAADGMAETLLLAAPADF